MQLLGYAVKKKIRADFYRQAEAWVRSRAFNEEEFCKKILKLLNQEDMKAHRFIPGPFKINRKCVSGTRSLAVAEALHKYWLKLKDIAVSKKVGARF